LAARGAVGGFGGGAGIERRPTLALAGEAGRIAAELGVKNIALSITHTESQALAQVIFEG